MNKKLLAAYKNFLEIRCLEKGPGELTDYKWLIMPKVLSIELMTYSQMLFEHVQELSDSINELHLYTNNLMAWEKVIKKIDKGIKYELAREHIVPYATLAINIIFVLKYRFIYSVAHLCNQANIVKFNKEWEDFLPNDEEITFDHANFAGTHWKEYKKLKLSIEKIGNKIFNDSTKNFINKYNYRYPPAVEVGDFEFLERKIINKKTTYCIVSADSLKLKVLIPALTDQYKLLLSVYENYKKLISSQVDSVQDEKI